MSKSLKRLVAVFMLLWLPLSGGSALAASLAMQLQQGGCHEQVAMMDMSHEGMDGHDMMHHDHEGMQAADDSGCTACGVCHLACTTYMEPSPVAVLPALVGSQAVSGAPDNLVSHLSAPLDPPPLVAA